MPCNQVAADARSSLTSRRVAVIGAGIGGLTCALQLQGQGREVIVLDRGRHAGGRLSSRHTRTQDGLAVCFDRGAPFFSVSQVQFERRVDSWIEAGLCARWQARQAVWTTEGLRVRERPDALYVGVPRMGALCRHLAEGLDVRPKTRVTDLARTEGGWRIESIALREKSMQLIEVDAVVLAAPPRQAAPLVAAHSEKLAAACRVGPFRATWVTMLLVKDELLGAPDVLEVEDDPLIALLIRDDAKPGRRRTPGHSQWVAHARFDWSAGQLDSAAEKVVTLMAPAARCILGAASQTDLAADRLLHAEAHRWSLARPAVCKAEPYLADPNLDLALCGDGFGGSGVQAACLSGEAAASAV